MDQIQSVIKGGENWMSMSLGRNSKGITLWVKTIPQVEEFIANLSMRDDRDGPAVAAAPRGRVVNRNAPPPGFVEDANWGVPINQAPPKAGVNEPQFDDLISKYGKRWLPIGDEKLNVYSIGQELDTPYFTFNAIGQGFLARNGEVNLSFLRFKGISGPEGVKFVIVGPMGTSDARAMCGRIGPIAKQFFTDNIAPFNINLRISSTEI